MFDCYGHLFTPAKRRDRLHLTRATRRAVTRSADTKTRCQRLLEALDIYPLGGAGGELNGGGTASCPACGGCDSTSRFTDAA